MKFYNDPLVSGGAVCPLEFMKRCLYLCPEFFEDITADRLPSDGVTTAHLNDDVPDRTLDATAVYTRSIAQDWSRRSQPSYWSLRRGSPFRNGVLAIPDDRAVQKDRDLGWKQKEGASFSEPPFCVTQNRRWHYRFEGSVPGEPTLRDRA